MNTYDLERINAYAKLAPTLRSGGADVPQDVSGELLTDRFADHLIKLR